MDTPEEHNGAKPDAHKAAKWTPPRGVRLFTIPTCIKRPHAVQWRAEGKRKTKSFRTQQAATDFAKALAGDAKRDGVAAYRLDASEARSWRAFVARLGPDVSLDAVLACWNRHGAARPKFTVSAAVPQFLAAKEAEGVAEATLGHYRPVYARLAAALGPLDVRAVTREQVAGWVAELEAPDSTRRTHQVRADGFFTWLKNSRMIDDNPCDGLKPVKIVAEEVAVMTVEDAHSLFANNESEPPELLGRLALECFAGLRFSSAAAVVGDDVRFEEKGIVLPAAKIKTRRRQFIDGLPDNLWHWLNRSNPAHWTMTPRQYLEAKSLAFVRARVPHAHNACRHSFATYHMSLGKDAAKTAAILCHTSQKMLWQHYKGRATEAQGAAYFLCYPTGATSLLDSRGKRAR